MLDPIEVWAARRPLVYRLLESRRTPGRVRRVGWAFYWNVLLRLRYWRWYPVTNPRLTYLVCLVIASVTIAVTRGRS